MGPQYWKPGTQTELKKCSERKSPACDPTETDGCCAVIPCEYCLLFEVYGEDDQYGTATFETDSWTGTVAGAAFRAFWERNYSTDECEFVVTMNNEEVYRKSCYQGQSCRDSSDSVEVDIPYLEGLLTWTKVLKRPLHYVIDPDTGCRTWFCGDCECSCECLCVEITDSYGDPIADGEICDVSYDCDPPLWAGTVGEYELSFGLARDSYGECVIIPSIDGVEQDPVAADGCGAVSATVVTPTGDTISVTCKQCCCRCDGNCVGCCFCNQFPATNVDYVIDAPHCAALDGLTGNISGPDTGEPTGCGSCVSLPNNATTHDVPQFLWDDAGVPGECIPQISANFNFRFLMKCDENQPNSETDPNTTEACCRNVRLLVVDSLNETSFEIPPLSCSCDPLSGMTAIFPLDQLYPDCDTFYSSGPCAGRCSKSQIGDGPGGSCSLAGATLTITQAC